VCDVVVTHVADLSSIFLPVASGVWRPRMRVVRVDPAAFEDAELAEGAALLREGRLVAFPTETVYGLGANALDAAAVARIFLAKGRPQDNPLIVHIGELRELERLVDHVPPAAAALAQRFWPGPMTLVLRRKQGAIPDVVTAGLPSVAVRMPSHPVARRLITLAGVPVAAPSANLSGRPSPTTAAHVLADYSGRPAGAEPVPLLIDSGACACGIESTVVDVECAAAGGRPLVLRPGGLTLEALRTVVPAMGVYSRGVHGTVLAEKPATPGLKYRHYAPTAPVILFDPGADTPHGGVFDDFALRRAAAGVLVEWLHKLSGSAVGILRTHVGQDAWPYDVHAAGHVLHPGMASPSSPSSSSSSATKIAPVATEPLQPPGNAPVYVVDVGDERTDLAGTEHGLFDALRSLDAPGVAAILVEGVAEHGEGLAIMNRLRKAAATVVDVSPQTLASMQFHAAAPSATPPGEIHMPGAHDS